MENSGKYSLPVVCLYQSKHTAGSLLFHGEHLFRSGLLFKLWLAAGFSGGTFGGSVLRLIFFIGGFFCVG